MLMSGFSFWLGCLHLKLEKVCIVVYISFILKTSNKNRRKIPIGEDKESSETHI